MSMHVRIGVVLAAFVLLAPQAGAVMITQLDPDDSYADADWTISNEPNASVILVGLRVEYFKPEMIGSPVLLQFVLDANDLDLSGAPKDIHLVNYGDLDDPNVSLINSTGVTWEDFHVLLVNVPTYLAEYAAAGFTDLAGVDSDPFGTPTVSASDRLGFDGATLSDRGSEALLRGVHVEHNGTDGGVFYIKLIPTPEPATLALLVVGAAAIVTRRRRRVV
ncbi:MAG TPA: PEP-CTERM sorting domain-containing protein [Phycisphaerae bacterium]|nr:PEP-CTERM sorting domain-containing protein [Phycisphaerae bacterium]